MLIGCCFKIAHNHYYSRAILFLSMSFGQALVFILPLFLSNLVAYNTMVSKNNNTAETYFLGKNVSIFKVEKPLEWNKKTTTIK